MWKKSCAGRPGHALPLLPLLRYPLPNRARWSSPSWSGNRRRAIRGVVFPANADLNSDQLTDVNELLDYRDIVYNNLAVQENPADAFPGVLRPLVQAPGVFPVARGSPPAGMGGENARPCSIPFRSWGP